MNTPKMIHNIYKHKYLTHNLEGPDLCGDGGLGRQELFLGGGGEVVGRGLFIKIPFCAV